MFHTRLWQQKIYLLFLGLYLVSQYMSQSSCTVSPKSLDKKKTPALVQYSPVAKGDKAESDRLVIG